MGAIEDYLSKKQPKRNKLREINKKIRNNRVERKDFRDLEKVLIKSKKYTEKDKKEFNECIEESFQEFRKLKKKREKIFKEEQYL